MLWWALAKVVEEVHTVSDGAAEQIYERLSAGFSNDVPACHLDPADGGAVCAHDMPGASDKDSFEDAFDVKGALAENEWADRVHRCQNDFSTWVGGGFAKANEAFIGAYLEHDCNEAMSSAECPVLVLAERHCDGRGAYLGHMHVTS
jgi:hypothetical protein